MTDPRLELAAAASGQEAERVLDELDRIRPIIRLRSSASLSHGRVAAALAAMLMREFPHTVIVGDAPLGVNPWGARRLADMADTLDHVRPTPVRAPVVDVVIALDGDDQPADFWVGGGDLTAIVSRSVVPLSDADVTLGPQAAVALVAAEVAKIAFARLGVPTRPLGGQETLVWNLVDYQLNPSDVLGPVSARVSALAALGCGSVGSSAAAVMAMQPMSGDFQAVDGDQMDPRRNPFRYPAVVTQEPVDKARWVSDLLVSAGWRMTDAPFVGSVGNWVARRAKPGFHGVAMTSVDERDGRLQVADLLAQTTISAGVRGLAFHVQREHLGDGLACPFCQFVSLDPPAARADINAELTGLSRERVLELSIDDRLTAEDLAIATAAGKIRPERADELLGRRLADLVRESYAQVDIGGPATGVRVAAPHVSWLAGVLQAAEVFKAGLGLPLVDRRVDVDLVGLPTGIRRRDVADQSGRCVCHSPWRRRWIKRLYGGLGSN